MFNDMFDHVSNRGRSENDMMKRAAYRSNDHQSPVNPPINSTPVLLAAVFVAAAAMLCPAQTVAALSDTKPPAPDTKPLGASGSPSTPAIRLQGVHAVTFHDNGRPAVTLALVLAGD